MEYSRDGRTIIADVQNDLKELCIGFLSAQNIQNIDESKALNQYCEMRLRLLPEKPRTIHRPMSFTIPAGYETGIRALENAIETGADLKRFMSKRILDASYEDKMINDWGLFHFHISEKDYKKDPRFCKRTGYLLVAFVDIDYDDDIYFVEISHHNSSPWTKQHLIRILADNWPDMMDRYRVKLGKDNIVSLTENVTDEQYKNLRKANINTFVDLGDGRVFMGMNHGLTTAGTSVRATMMANRLMRYSYDAEQTLKSYPKTICELLDQCFVHPDESYQLKLKELHRFEYTFDCEGAELRIRHYQGENGKWRVEVRTSGGTERTPSR